MKLRSGKALQQPNEQEARFAVLDQAHNMVQPTVGETSQQGAAGAAAAQQATTQPQAFDPPPAAVAPHQLPALDGGVNAATIAALANMVQQAGLATAGEAAELVGLPPAAVQHRIDNPVRRPAGASPTPALFEVGTDARFTRLANNLQLASQKEAIYLFPLTSYSFDLAAELQELTAVPDTLELRHRLAAAAAYATNLHHLSLQRFELLNWFAAHPHALSTLQAIEAQLEDGVVQQQITTPAIKAAMERIDAAAITALAKRAGAAKAGGGKKHDSDHHKNKNNDNKNSTAGGSKAPAHGK